MYLDNTPATIIYFFGCQTYFLRSASGVIVRAILYNNSSDLPW